MVSTIGKTRWSHGGEALLAGLGFSGEMPDGLVLRETSLSFPRARTLVPQNALTVLSKEGFSDAMPNSLAWATRRAAARWNLRTAERVVTLSHAMGQLCEPIRRSPVEVCPVSVPIDVIEKSKHLRWHRTTSNDIVIVGTVAPYKKIETVLQAVSAAGSNNRLILLGFAQEDYRLSLSSLAERLAVEMRINVASRSEVLEAITTSKYVVLPSSAESLGFPLGEGLALGCPVLASDIPAHVELAVRAGAKVGWFSPNDHEQLAELLSTPATNFEASDNDREQWTEEWAKLRRNLSVSTA